jgi:hypothetical protein
MDNFAKCFGYDTENPAYQAAIQNAAQQGLPQDGSQHSPENKSLAETAATIVHHDKTPPEPPEPAFPTVTSRYSSRAKKAVFNFSKHSNDELLEHLGNCLLELWPSSQNFVVYKSRQAKDGGWQLRIKSDNDPQKIELCLHRIRTLTGNCQVLGYTGEKFVAAAKKIQSQNSILHALCEPRVTFYRDQHGDVCATTEEDEASMACEEILTKKREYEAAYAVMASRGSASFFKQQQYELAPGSNIPGPEGLFIYSLVADPLPSIMTHERKMLAIELLLRSLDRRADSIQDYVQEKLCDIAHSLDEKTLNGLYRKHCSPASRLWLRRVTWTHRDSEASKNYSAASTKCRYCRYALGGLIFKQPEEGRRLSVEEIQEFKDLVLAAVMVDPSSQAISIACRILDIVYMQASPEQSYIIFEEAMMLLKEKGGILPFENEKHLVEGLETFQHLKPFLHGRTEPLDDDGDPIVVSDEESS